MPWLLPQPPRRHAATGMTPPDDVDVMMTMLMVSTLGTARFLEVGGKSHISVLLQVGASHLSQPHILPLLPLVPVASEAGLPGSGLYMLNAAVHR